MVEINSQLFRVIVDDRKPYSDLLSRTLATDPLRLGAKEGV